MKYKVGDKVRIREDLKCESPYHEYPFCDEMEVFKGKVATIKKCAGEYYRIDLDNEKWKWTDRMLELAKELNKEHWAKEIVEIAKHEEDVAVDKKTLKPISCEYLGDCKQCLFKGDCINNRVKWFDSEYVEPKIKLTPFEYEYLNRFKKMEYETIVRDKNGVICFHKHQPYKSEKHWGAIGEARTLPFDDMFKFIKWEDEAPYYIKYILENCKVIENVD